VQQASQAPSGQDSARHLRLVNLYPAKQWLLRTAPQVYIKIRLARTHASIVMRGHHAHQQVLHLQHALLANSQLKALLPAHRALLGIYAAIKLKLVKLLVYMGSILILLLLLMYVKHVQTVINALKMQFLLKRLSLPKVQLAQLVILKLVRIVSMLASETLSLWLQLVLLP
jgi:hypothetical protein